MNTQASEGDARARVRRVTYEEWTRLLCDHFFRPEFDGIPVMFFVDDAAVADVYDGAPEDAVASLVTAVRQQLRVSHPRRLFEQIETEGRRWRRAGGQGPPPFLPLLAVAVLAATRMGRRRDRAAHNYYKPFRELLGVDVQIAELQASSGDAMPYLWQWLQWWLDAKHRGRLGFSTIVGGYFTYDYADSQTLFNNSDRDRLTQFFRWIGLKPGETLEQSELLTYFRIWASRRDDLSEGAAHMLEHEGHNQQLARIIKAAADRWRGVVRDEGRREAEIVITLELFPRPRLALVAQRPEGFPAELICRSSLGQPVTLNSSQTGWYDELDIPVATSVLDSGLRFTGDGMQVRLPTYNVHVLEKNADLGRWASVPQLSPGDPAWLLVRNTALLDTTTYLENTARKGWRLIQRQGVAPTGWTLIGDVVIESATDDAGPPQLARIVPRVQNRFSFKGGLPLPRGWDTYLFNGEPDVWLPPAPAQRREFAVDLDGDVIVVPQGSTHIRLASLGLQEGGHALTLEGISRAFSTIRTLGHITPQSTRLIGHLVGLVDGVPSAIASGARSLESNRTTGVVRILGAAVQDPDAILGEYPSAPIILPTAAIRRVLVGARPGEIDEIPAPSKPPWMIRAQLGFQVFEFTPRFPVVWIITEWHLDPTSRVRLKRQLEPASAAEDASAAGIDAWVRAITEVPPPSDTDAAGLWATYQRAAEAARR